MFVLVSMEGDLKIGLDGKDPSRVPSTECVVEFGGRAGELEVDGERNVNASVFQGFGIVDSLITSV